jgi:hypothetical protein
MSETLKNIDNVANKGLWAGLAVAGLGLLWNPLLFPGVVVAGTSASWKVGRHFSQSRSSK